MQNKPLILIVDDEPLNLKLLEGILTPLDYEMQFVNNGRDALVNIEARTPDLILLDIMMPGISGYEVLKRIRADERYRTVPVIMLTALRDKKDRITAIEGGCDDFISKPFDKDEILAKIKTFLKLNYYRRLLDEREELEYIIDNMNEGILIFDRNMKIKKMNQKAKDLFSLHKIDKNCDFFFHIGSDFKLHCDGDLAENILEDTLTFMLERPETQETKPLFLLVRSNVIKNLDGERDSVVLIIRDITEERREEALKQDFLSLISHKLKAPITLITLLLSLFESDEHGSLNAQQRETIDKISKLNSNQKLMVEKLLRFTALNRSDLKPKDELINLHEYLPKLVNEIIGESKRERVKYTVEGDKTLLLSMDKQYFDMIIESLVDNAIKFNNNKIEKRVKVGCKKNQSGIEIYVEDNGIGIPQEEIKKIFDKFYQVEKYFTGNVEGVGLGLSAVQRIVKAYNGRIIIESKINMGTKVILNFHG